MWTSGGPASVPAARAPWQRAQLSLKSRSPSASSAGTGPGSKAGGRVRATLARGEQRHRGQERAPAAPDHEKLPREPVSRRDDGAPHPLLQRGQVGRGEPGRLDRLEHLHHGGGPAEAPVMLGKRVAGAVQRQRKDGDARVDREPERAVLERQQLGGGRSGTFGEDHHRHPLREDLPAAGHRFDGAGAEAALHRHVTREVHQPAHHRNPEQLRLGEPLHLPRQMADQQDVGERLVIGDHDVGAPRIGRHGAGVAELPERIERRDGAADPAEEIADPVASGVAQGGQPHQRHHRQPEQHADHQDQPSPHRDERLPETDMLPRRLRE